MAVRKRAWATKAGEHREAWVVDYLDAQGERHIETFSRKKDADARHATVQVRVLEGIHTPLAKSISVEEASELWLNTCAVNGLERTTLDTYRQHVDLHIKPFLGSRRLAQLTVPMMRDFADQLHRAGRSHAMIKKIMVRLGSVLADAQERGHVQQNVVRNLRASRRRGSEHQADARARGKLKVGVDIPPHRTRSAPLLASYGAAGGR